MLSPLVEKKRAKRRRRAAPLRVKVDQVTIPIYPDRSRKLVRGKWRNYPRFTLAYYSREADGKKRRVRVSFADLAEAKAEAQRVATLIAHQEAAVLRLSNADAASYVAALDALRPLNVSLSSAVSEYVEARRFAPAGTLVAAAKDYAQRNRATWRDVRIRAVVAELLTAAKQDKMSTRYLQSLRSHLENRFARDFDMNIASATAPQMEKWLRDTAAGPRTRNNIRLSIVRLFNFAKARGYLPKGGETEADHIARAKDRGGKIGILRPEELQRLLSVADEEAELYLCLGAFTGLRSAELIRLSWEDVKLARGYIDVAKDKAKTATRRLVPIQQNLAGWLEPFVREKRAGRVFVSEHAADRTITLAKQIGVAWPNNALRHSYATYRLAQCQDAPRVALEMGNSPQMLFRNYREIADEQDAAAWFGIERAPGANVVRGTFAQKSS
jgi:integrase